MNAPRLLLLATLSLTAFCSTSTPSHAAHYSWTSEVPPDMHTPIALRDNAAMDAAGNFFVLLDKQVHDPIVYVRIRNSSGIWGPLTVTSINPGFVLDELVINPNTGNPIALGVDTVSTGVLGLVGYEYTGAAWVRTVFNERPNNRASAFDYDESGRLHFLYWDRDTKDLTYGNYFAGTTTSHAMSTLGGSSYSELEIQASSNGAQPIFATVYDPSGWVFTSVSTNDGANWGTITIPGYGFTGVSYRGQELLTELDSNQRLHLFFRVQIAGSTYTRYRSLTLDGTLSSYSDLAMTDGTWWIFLLDDQPHFVYAANVAGRPVTVEHLTTGGWQSEQPDPGWTFSNLFGVDARDGRIMILATDSAQDEYFYIGEDSIAAAMVFGSGFE